MDRPIGSITLSEPSNTAETESRAARARGVLDEFLRRRGAGDSVDEDQLVADHRGLMPELGRELRKLTLIDRARRLKHRPMPAPDAFPGYEVISELARGGQAVVYRAVQDGTKRSVAIKVLRDGTFGSEHDRARFEREAEILGQLAHRNIITIHETGEAGGQTYFVMDYVAGRPLDEYVAAANLDVAGTLRLFLKVCRAVEVAHLRGVIHRDLKSSNIRVDRAGEPQVLDFGLAKVEWDDAANVTMTADGQFVGSLPWASPEQVEATANDIDLRTDVYALGVVLYRLLTGRFPYKVIGPMRRVMETISTVDPVPPRTLRRAINTDVETIVLKCLQKNRERRYQGAGDLARDIERCLADEPIEARRDSSLYVLGKTLRRYRIQAAVAAAFLVLTVGFAATMSVQYRRALSAEREAAGREQAAMLALEGLQEIFSHSLREPVTDRELLDGIASQAVERLRSEPQGQLQLVLALASICRGHEFWDLASMWTTRALGLQAVAPYSDVRHRAAILHDLGQVLRQAGQLAESEERLREALRIRMQLFRPDHPDVAMTSLHLARTLVRLGRYSEAERLYFDAVRILRSGPQDRPELVEALLDTGSFLDNKGDYERAESMMREAVALGRLHQAGDELLIANTLSVLSGVLQSQSLFDESYDLCNEALQINQRHYPDHPRLNLILNQIGLLAKDMGRYDEAESHIQRALTLVERAHGRHHKGTAYTYHSLAKVFSDAGRLEQAERACRTALELHIEVHGPDHRDTARPMTDLGLILVRQGRHAEAVPLLQRALEIRETTKPAGHWKTAKTRSILGAALTGLGRYRQAEQLLLSGHEDIARDRGPMHRRTREAVQRIVDLYVAWGRQDDASRWRGLIP